MDSLLKKCVYANFFVIASGIGILYSFAKVVPQAEIFVIELQQWIISFFSLTLSANIICTCAYLDNNTLPRMF